MQPIVRYLAALLLLAAPAAAEPELDGALTQGGLVFGKVEPGEQVKLDGRPVKVAADGRFVVGFGRDAELSHVLEVGRPGEAPRLLEIRLEDREFPIERVDGLPPETVTLPPEYYERRRRETGMVQRARAPVSDMLHWVEGFIWPAEGRISGVYGSQRILNGEPRSPHFGLDVAAPVGTPVVAPASGVVRLAEPDFLLEGGIVIIDHGFGVTSTLFHMSRVDVAEGDRVAQGQRIGAIGAAGRASGPHVDWRINWLDERIDPQLLVGGPTGGEASP